MSADPDFLDRAACRREDPELFFPISDQGAANQRQIARALAVCHQCPVETDCLDWALAHGADHGIWGGQTEWARRNARQGAEGVRS